ncbi:hypothetical protein HDU85_004490 [Gaertneriomyces sp. JEL0708]|nr:hypothetical protein HDU85_004490 [Gaertneriomyces sp. JEL0708]
MVDYEHFLNTLRQSEAVSLMNHFKAFLQRFNSEKRPIMQQRKMVSSFLHFIYGESLQNSLFAEVSDDAELDNIREGWEKLIMMNIFDQVFGGPGTDDVKMSTHLAKKVEGFQWVQEHHLDLPFSFHHTLEVAQAELLRVNGFRAPRDKLIILHNTTQLVVDLIRKASLENAGNDHLLPSLILTIIRANPPNLISNIKYIMRFRNQAELEKGENQFCLTNLMSAVSFIYNMTPKSLTLSDQEKLQYGVPRELPPRPEGFGSSSSTSSPRNENGPVPQVSQLASKVYSSTSGFFNTLIREAKIFGETAAGKVDGLVNQLSTNSDDEEDRHNGPPLPPRRGRHENYDGSMYPGNIRTRGEPDHTKPWLMEPSPMIPVESLSPPIRPDQPPARSQAEMEDYELQLAMALSLSSMEEDKKNREQTTTGTLINLAEEPAEEPAAPLVVEDHASADTSPVTETPEKSSPPNTESSTELPDTQQKRNHAKESENAASSESLL